MEMSTIQQSLDKIASLLADQAPSVKDYWTYGITILGISVTGFFSWRLYVATKDMAVATIATLEFNKLISKKNEDRDKLLQEKDNKIKEGYRAIVLSRISIVTHVLDNQLKNRETFQRDLFRSVTDEIGVEVSELIQYFPDVVISNLINAYDGLKIFKNHYLSSDEEVKKYDFFADVERLSKMFHDTKDKFTNK